MKSLANPRKHILLMTATITPHNAPNLVRTDPVARLKDYEAALRFYLDLIDCPLYGIVFVENSDSDVTTLRKLVANRGLADRVEFLCNYGVHHYSEESPSIRRIQAARLRHDGLADCEGSWAGACGLENHRTVHCKKPAIGYRWRPGFFRCICRHEEQPHALDGHAPDGLDQRRIRSLISRRRRRPGLKNARNHDARIRAQTSSWRTLGSAISPRTASRWYPRFG